LKSVCPRALGDRTVAVKQKQKARADTLVMWGHILSRKGKFKDKKEKKPSSWSMEEARQWALRNNLKSLVKIIEDEDLNGDNLVNDLDEETLREFGMKKLHIKSALRQIKALNMAQGAPGDGSSTVKDCVCVIVANSSYSDSSGFSEVSIAVNEMNVVAQSIRKAANWEVFTASNLDEQSFKNTIDQNLPHWSKGYSVICFYFIGHGFMHLRDQYLVSTDGVPVNTKTFLNHPLVKSKNAIAIFNCCRVQMTGEELVKFQKKSVSFENNFDDLSGDTRHVQSTGQRLICYCAEDNQKVYYQKGLNNSTLFAKEFVKSLNQKVSSGKNFDFKEVVTLSTKICNGNVEDNSLFQATFKV